MKDDESTRPAKETWEMQNRNAPGALDDDHPFAALVGHDPTLMKAMSDALRVLQANTTDQRLKDSIGEAASGRLSFTELLADSNFSETYTIPADSCREAIAERRDNMSEEEQELMADAVRNHVDRLAREHELEHEVRKAFGNLAD